MKKKSVKMSACCSPHGYCPGSCLKFFLGVGVGLLLAHPLADPHPVRWALGFFAVAIIYHLVAGKKSCCKN